MTLSSLLPVLGTRQQGNPVRPEKLLIIREGEQDKRSSPGFVVQKAPDDLQEFSSPGTSTPGVQQVWVPTPRGCGGQALPDQAAGPWVLQGFPSLA